ncbi:MAG: Heimdall-CTERM domain-containing surface protein [Candidatus Hermodarchaeota archaeon]
MSTYRSLKVIIPLFVIIWISSCVSLANNSVMANEYSYTIKKAEVQPPKQNSAPTINITYPEEGEAIEIIIDSTVNITWTASDPENDSLVFNVFYSATETNWSALFGGKSLTKTWYNLYARNLTRGNAYIRVTATDGINEAEDVINFLIVKAELVPGFEIWSIIIGISIIPIIQIYRKRKLSLKSYN